MKIDNEIFVVKNWLTDSYVPISLDEAVKMFNTYYGVVVLVNKNTIINIMFLPDGYIGECEDVINDYYNYVESITGLIIE